jgi:outer membrane protein
LRPRLGAAQEITLNRKFDAMKNTTYLSLMLCAVALSGVPAFAQTMEAPWLVRIRTVHINSSNNDATGYNLTMSSRTVPEVSASYFFTRNVALELMMMMPQAHTLYAQDLRLGTFEQAPPTFLLQYHFEAPGFKPYVGAGLNFTQFSAVKVPGFDLEKNSVGAALQVGVDIPVARNLSLNVDLKKIYMGVDFYHSSGTNLGAFKIDPLLFGVGLGLRF